MKNSLKMVALATLLVVSAIGLAQGGGGGGGGGRGGGRMMMMGGGGGNRAMMLVRKDVREDLALSADQVKQLDDIRAKWDEEESTRRENMRAGGGGGDRDAMMAEMRKNMEAYQAKVDAVLTPEQVTRLKEISFQLRGNGAIMDPEVQKSLDVTSAQKDQIEELRNKQQEASRAVFQRMRDGELDEDAMRELMTKNQKIMNEELGKILTAEQNEKLKAMGGAKPFKADPNEQGRRIGGGGGGGGF